MKKLFLLLTILSASSFAFADWQILVGARSGTIDSSSFASSNGVSYSSTAQTGFEAGGLFSQTFSSWFAARAGLMVGQFNENQSYTVSGFGNGSLTSNQTNIMVPILAEFMFGDYFSILAGGYYWTANAVTCNNTGLSVTSSCNFGQGSGFGPRVGAEVKFNTSIALDLAYEPKVQVAAAQGTNPATTLSSLVADFVYKF